MCKVTVTFFFLLLLSFASPVFSEQTPVLSKVETYDQLVSAIRGVRTASQARLQQAADAEKVREAWETGKLIDEHVLQHKERADYETYVMVKLQADLATSRSELYRMLQFARKYPIVAPGRQLTWSHYKALVSVDDNEIRGALEQRAEKEHWTRDRMRSEVARVNHVPEKEEALTAEMGKLNTYRVIRATAGENKGKLVLDLGFSNYLKPEKTSKFAEGNLVTLEKGKLKKTKAGKESLYTYRAYPFNIVDGDTFFAVIELGFNVSTVQKLRLRGLDAPEIETQDGAEARKFLAANLARSPVIIRSIKSDKYDRYLADVWVNGEYVNQQLVEEGLAAVVND